MYKKLLLMFSLSAFATAFAASCPNGEAYFEGRGEGVSNEDAKDKANLAISKSISSSLSSVTQDILHQVETADDYNETNKRTRSSKIETKLRNVQDVKDKDGYPKKENGKYIAERYICVSDAAKPYLNTLKDLARTLKTQTQKADRNSCKSINETYKSIENTESVLSSLARMSNEVQTEYERLREEYQSDEGGGLFLEIKENIFGEKSNVIASKLKEALSANNCRVERNICKTNGGYTLRINATACNHKNDGTFDHCSSCLKIDLLNGKNEIVLSPSVTEAAAWDSKTTACEKAFEMSAPKIFDKIKNNISEVCK
jgi:hypothetical protein